MTSGRDVYLERMAQEDKEKAEVEDNYDVVLDTLQKHHDKLWSITKSNMTSEFLGMGIMDDIRLEQMSQLKEAMDLWRRRDELREYFGVSGD